MLAVLDKSIAKCPRLCRFHTPRTQSLHSKMVVRDLHGKFAFILYDGSSKTTFIAAGNDFEGHLVLADDAETVKKVCGKSFAPFPKDIFFTSSGGLRSFEHPLNELKPVPRVDSSGQVCGSTFKVDAKSRKDTVGMHRV
ncbi:hypothetical protein ACSBR2_013262 [Camellia fascicularis]